MMDGTTESWLSLLQWAVAHRWPAVACVICIQLLLVASVAAVVVRLFARRAPATEHRIWVSVVALVLLLVPLHVGLGGWRIPVTWASASAVGLGQGIDSAAVMMASAPRRADSLDRADSSHRDVGVTASRVRVPIHMIGGDDRAESPIGDDDFKRDPAAPVLATDMSVADPENQAPETHRSAASRVAATVTLVYVFGSLWVVIRMLHGRYRLAKSVCHGADPDAATVRYANELQRGLGLTSLVRLKVSPACPMPLVFGIIRPTILLPQDFQTWTEPERRATLLHELTHLRRGDTRVAMLMRWMSVIYWFHPAVRFVVRRMVEARERATDIEVVQAEREHAGGMRAGQYAEAIVSVVARVGRRDHAGTVRAASIAMSGGAPLERRLATLLQASHAGRTSGRGASVPAAVLLAAVVGATTTQFVEAGADDPETIGPPVVESTDRGATVRDATDDDATDRDSHDLDSPHRDSTDPRRGDLATKIAPQDRDLVHRIRSIVSSGDRRQGAEPSDTVFHVWGQVVSSEGEPVPGASVVIRESSTARISSEPQKYVYRPDRHRVRVHDVFGTAVTDEEGRFEIRGARAPALPRRWSNTWRGGIVAAHESLGVGWLPLGDKKELRRVESDLKITLIPVGKIVGRLVAPDRTAVSHAVMGVFGLAKRARGNSPGHDELDLQQSQLEPRVRTDADGRFEIDGVPRGYAAMVTVNHPDWVLSSAAITIDDDLASGQGGEFGLLRGMRLQQSPAEILADPGVEVHGRVVGPDGDALPDILVSFSSSTTRTRTDADGKFRFAISTAAIRRVESAGRPVRINAFAGPTTGALSRHHEVPLDDVTAGRPIEIQLERAVLIRGTVVADDGEPVVDAAVSRVAESDFTSAVTKEDGAFELLVPIGRQILVVGTNEPGFALPRRHDVYSANDEKAASLQPHKYVDVSDGQPRDLEPWVVPRVKPRRVVVSLPDGRPAVGATAMLKDKQAWKNTSGNGRSRPPRILDRSDPTLTDESGLAELIPTGLVSEDGFVQAKYHVGATAYEGELPWSQASGGVLRLELRPAWIVEGRVLVDGKGVAGAKVSIGQSTSQSRTVNGRTFQAMMVTNHVQSVTDDDGWYRTAVPQGHRYSVSLQSMPGQDRGPGIGYGAVDQGNGRLRVKDFSFSTHAGEIAGVVVDSGGNAVPGCYVQVRRSFGAEPGFWLGHQTDSQFETDRSGRFHLRGVPDGKHQLSIRGPRGADGRRGASSTVTAVAGDVQMKITLVLASDASAEPPRLLPQRIVPTL